MPWSRCSERGIEDPTTRFQLWFTAFIPAPSSTISSCACRREHCCHGRDHCRQKTAVLGANHPYMFYGKAQSPVGSGGFSSEKASADAVAVLTTDLIAARWQVLMAADPSQDPQTVLNACAAYWNDPTRAAKICALARGKARCCTRAARA